jgi:hypothetical protein
MTSTAFDPFALRQLYQVDQARLELARKRQSAVWQGKKPDAWPIILSGTLTARQEQIPTPDFATAFNHPAMMLCQQMRPACALANAGSDGVPSIRANTGTGTLLACFGLEQQVTPDQMPWLQEHLTLEQAGQLSPDDINLATGTFARALEHIAFYREVMGEQIAIYCVDTQGPFDLAHLLLGDQIFYAMHDDPPLMHHIMELCLQLYIRCTEKVKGLTGEKTTSMVHGNSLYLPNAGVRICEDTTTIIGAAAVAEFALPYTRRAAAHFGGAWVHFCGRCDDLAGLLCQCPEVIGINYGIVPGKEDDFDFDREMDRMAEAGKVYHGSLPRKPAESGAAYLRRLHRYAKRGCLIPAGNAAVSDQDGFASARDALDFWYSL